MKLILSLYLLFCAFALHAQTDAVQISNIDSAIYHNPEIAPDFPGGQKAWMRFLLHKLMYPAEAQSIEIQGTVEVQFWVDTEGSSHDVTTIGGPEQLRAESVRIIKKVSKWVPAVDKGKKVNAWKIQPITFKLEAQ